MEVKNRGCKDDNPPIVVYTAIIGGYDDPPSIRRIDPRIRYVCVTDQNLIAPAPWETIKIGRRYADAKVEAGYYRTHPNELFGASVIVVWIDGNYRNVRFDGQRIMRWLGGCPLACLVHPSRVTGMEEAEAIEFFQLAPAESVQKWRRAMFEMGFPDDRGLAVTSLTIRDLRNPVTAKLNSDWWWSVENLCRRDQLGFPYALWTTGIQLRWIVIDAVRSKRWFRIVPHKNPVGRLVGER